MIREMLDDMNDGDQGKPGMRAEPFNSILNLFSINPKACCELRLSGIVIDAKGFLKTKRLQAFEQDAGPHPKSRMRISCRSEDSKRVFLAVWP